MASAGRPCTFASTTPRAWRTARILPDEKKDSAIGFLDRALAWLGGQGISVERVMTDNGSAYRSKAFRPAVTAAGARHKRTRPYTPRTNGKAERFATPSRIRRTASSTCSML
jgi:transposase InsO family protein